MKLFLAEAQRLTEANDVHPPLVLGAGQGAGAVDHHLAQARIDPTVAEDACAERAHPRSQLPMNSERPK